MDFSANMATVGALCSFTLMINMLFGFFRNRTRKYSLKWFLCIHAPIPLIFLARTSSHVGVLYIPFFLVAAVTGQVLGGKLEF